LSLQPFHKHISGKNRYLAGYAGNASRKAFTFAGKLSVTVVRILEKVVESGNLCRIFQNKSS